MEENFNTIIYERIRELIFVHEHINAIENVYYREHGNGYIDPSYALEKLNTAKDIIDIEIRFWEHMRNEK